MPKPDVAIDDWTAGRRYVRLLPAIAILAPASLSLAAWLLPVAGDGLSGYFERAPVSIWGVALVVAWFACLVLVAQLAFAGALRQGGMDGLTRVSTAEVHRAACVVGLAGTVWAYWVATGGSASRILEFWRTQQFNSLRAGFEYGVGVPTLRYATILAGAFTLVHLIRRGRPRLLDAASLIGLIGTAFLASRLAVVAAIFVTAVVIIASPQRSVRPRASTLAVAALAIVVLFTALNYSRSAGTYRESGIENPLAMAALNAQAYLASPTQVSLGFASLVMDNRFDPDVDGGHSADAILPTYASAPDQAGVRSAPISDLIEVNPSLTTNGALPDLLHSFGWIALGMAIATVGAASWLAGRFVGSGGVGPAVAGVILYGLAELWRIFLFNQGILHFLVLIGVAALCLGIFRGWAPGPRSSADPVPPSGSRGRRGP